MSNISIGGKVAAFRRKLVMERSLFGPKAVQRHALMRAALCHIQASQLIRILGRTSVLMLSAIHSNRARNGPCSESWCRR
jgi:hypothetical protein